MPRIAHHRAMGAASGDVILLATLDGAFDVLDAATRARLSTARLSLSQALAFAKQHGARHIYQQPADRRGRVMCEPGYLLRVADTSLEADAAS